MKINVAILDIIFVFSFQVSSWFYLSCGGLNEIGGVETTLFGLFYPHLHLSLIRRSLLKFRRNLLSMVAERSRREYISVERQLRRTNHTAKVLRTIILPETGAEIQMYRILLLHLLDYPYLVL